MPETIQVMISYGALDNGQLMEGYGFYDETNEMDAVWLSEGELKAAARSLLGEDKVAAATSLCHELGVGLEEGVEGGKYAVYKSGEGEELMVCLRRLCIGFEPCSNHHVLLLSSSPSFLLWQLYSQPFFDLASAHRGGHLSLPSNWLCPFSTIY